MLVLVLWAALDHPVIEALSVKQHFPFSLPLRDVTRKKKQ
jgi:hypothetical protein